MSRGNWREKCVIFYNDCVESFYKQFFTSNSRRCIFIGGAGFDPRSVGILEKLCVSLGDRLDTIVVREKRPNPDSELLNRANKNLKIIESICRSLTIEEIDIFSDDNAVVGGHNAIRALEGIDCKNYTDIVLDMSALSNGISYPIAAYLSQQADQANLNLHIAVQSNPQFDEAISSQANDRVEVIKGFKLESAYGGYKKAILWLPVLSESNYHSMFLLRTSINPHDICPILPFPSEDPKKGDRIASNFFAYITNDWMSATDNEWNVEPQSFLYADDRKPLDIYRSIISLDNERTPVFEALGGSTMVLSPSGNKISSMGVLMAALERGFPVMYVEALSYDVDWSKIDAVDTNATEFVHIWLKGEAYSNNESIDAK